MGPLRGHFRGLLAPSFTGRSWPHFPIRSTPSAAPLFCICVARAMALPHDHVSCRYMVLDLPDRDKPIAPMIDVSRVIQYRCAIESFWICEPFIVQEKYTWRQFTGSKRFRYHDLVRTWHVRIGMIFTVPFLEYSRLSTCCEVPDEKWQCLYFRYCKEVPHNLSYREEPNWPVRDS